MRSNRPRLLVTGFGPFPGMTRNPSADLAQRVAASPRWRRLGVAVRALVLPTTYAALNEVLEPAISSESPDAMLMIGVAGRSRQVRIERRALNRVSLLLPDAAGWRPPTLAVAAGAMVRRSRVEAAPVCASLRRCGVAARPSHDAGRYLCNAAYHRALADGIPALFVHIPKRPALRPSNDSRRRRSATDALAEGLVDVGLQLLACAGRERRRIRAS